ncbi:MAG: membrane protein insertase YidC [Planctomycetota bacterium]|nr:membrane protein insertase YidC [Planctomycetota bacterium]MDI6787619.1 membrane protein insertase YidC [Planctomycetota bacterium]
MDKRTLLFILLSVLIWFGYIYFIAPLFVQKEQKPSVTETPTQPSRQDSLSSPQETKEGEGGIDSKRAESTKESPAFQHPADIPLKYKTLENPHLRAVITNKGAVIESLTLKHYQSVLTDSNLSLINSNSALSVKLLSSSLELQNAFWEVMDETDSLTLRTVSPSYDPEGSQDENPEGQGESVKLRYTTSEGLIIYKTFALSKHNYALDFAIGLENISSIPITSAFYIKGTENIPPESYDHTDITGLYSYTNPPLLENSFPVAGKDIKWYVEAHPSPAKLKENNNSLTLIRGKNNVCWSGIANKYFATILVPLSIADMSIYGFDLLLPPIANPVTNTNLSGAQAGVSPNIGFYLQTKEFIIKPAETKQIGFIFYAGPKKASELAPFSHLGFDRILSYGWFGVISKIILWILFGLYKMFHNYGTAIVVLTVLIKLVLFPLSKKGQVSMYHLQKLQPRIKALQEQYKNDKRKFGEEQLKLWKEYGVNPLSGCLPMFLQIPVFIGLYWGLAQAIELRQAPFTLWITDLSQPDRLCRLPFPILGAEYLHVLPLVMTLSWLIQSLTQPKSPDPQARQQQKLFIFMPLIFGILFYNVPSGLTLYWFTSTLLGVVEQLIIKKYYFR